MNLFQNQEDLSRKSPREVVEWVVKEAKNPVITTNFRPYEAAILHLVTQVAPEIKVIWCDTGYNTPQTYRHVKDLKERLNLNLLTYVPKETVGYRNVVLGIPEVDTPEHRLFSEQVKLEPFRRAMDEHRPDYWFTNLRQGQTAFRDSIDVISVSKSGVVKVSPFYRFSDEDLDAYLEKHDLPNEKNYFDPTKALANRECGIHQ